VTDPQKIRLRDIGHPDICTVFTYQKVFNKEESEEIKKDCKSGALGCVACKKRLAAKLNDSLKDIRAKRMELNNNIHGVEETFTEGSKKARSIATKTLEEAMSLMKIDGKSS